ncbi:MAG: glycine cleavage system aminomethyltransferase GcvT [Cyanobacteria bacterium SZAS TMP-1]|nr:glycine cleavage system aminomethyltransferase GcvT [Cyanobacteria bacterium SZAS TMP-1]
MVATTLRETALAKTHVKLSARMVDFAGWNMPVQYKSIITEHMATREKIGLFDVSHMGEFLVTGAKAFDFVQHVIANDLNRLTEPDRALYSQLCYEDGGTVDDLIVYRRKEDFLLVVNASNIDKDFAWLSEHKGKFGISLTDISEQTGLLALQGPFAVPLLSEIVGDWVAKLPSFGYGEAKVDGHSFSFGRTGYTGEDGFEIFVGTESLEWLWNMLLERGAKFGIEPCGLGARDTLRLEAGLPLYGHELEKDITPIEAGLGWSVKPDKGDFIGRDVLAKQKAGDLKRQIVCLKAEGKAIPRQGYSVFQGDTEVGTVTSGTQGIFVGYPIAFAMLNRDVAKVGESVQVAIRDNRVASTVVNRPWYKRKK